MFDNFRDITHSYIQLDCMYSNCQKFCFGILVEKWGISLKKKKSSMLTQLVGTRDLLREDKNFWTKVL